jgi:hypothetical protein
MADKLLAAAQRRWRRFDGHELVAAVKFKDGERVTDNETATIEEKVAALLELGDLQLKLAGASIPSPRPIPIAVRRPILRPALTGLRADQLGNLGLHHLRRDRLDRLADHVCVLVEQHLPDDLLDRHPVGTGHAAPPFVES